MIVYIYGNNVNNNIDNKNIINNFNKNTDNNINNNNMKLIKQNLNIIYKNKLNNNETIIYSNNNLTLIENNVFYNNSAISSSIYLISKINANYIATFNVISINNNKSNYSACEIVNNNINKISIGKNVNVLYKTNNNPLLLIKNNVDELIIPYEFHLNKDGFYYIDPCIHPDPYYGDVVTPCGGGGGSSGSGGSSSSCGTCTVTTKTSSTSMSGYTDITSNININNNAISINGGSVTATVHITSFSGSSTPARLKVNGICDNTFTVSGTGTFTINNVYANNYGNVSVDVSYVSSCKITTYVHCDPDYAHTDKSISHAYTGSTYYYNYMLKNYIGYDGNNTIYLTNTSGAATSTLYEFYALYANETKCYNENGFKAPMSNSIGLNTSISESYNENYHVECLDVTMIGGASGYGGSQTSSVCDDHQIIEETSCKLAPYYMNLSIEGINNPGSDALCYKALHSTGINTTTTYQSEKPGYDITTAEENILANIVNATVKYMGIQTILSSIAKYYSDASLDSYNVAAYGNGPVYIHFEVKPDSGLKVNNNDMRYTYGTIVTYSIQIKNFTVPQEFKLGFDNIYGCSKSDYEGGSTNTINGASTSLTVNSVTASAIYGTVEHNDEPVNLTKTLYLYIEDVNNNNFYKVPIKNGNYLFFAEPDNEYKIYYNDNGDFNLLKTINASNLTAGSSFNYNIHYSDIND